MVQHEVTRGTPGVTRVHAADGSCQDAAETLPLNHLGDEQQPVVRLRWEQCNSERCHRQAVQVLKGWTSCTTMSIQVCAQEGICHAM